MFIIGKIRPTASYSLGTVNLILNGASTSYYLDFSDSYNYVGTLTIENNIISWYYSSDAAGQMNYSSQVYNYICIGV